MNQIRTPLSLLIAALMLFNMWFLAPPAVFAATYGPDDRLTDPAVSYDENGNLLDDGTTAYIYDTANRLVQTATGSDTNAYTYDGRGNLVEINENGTATELVLNENTPYPTILGEIQGATTRSYAYGMGLHAQKHGGAVAYPLLDHQGTIRHMTDAAGAVTHSRYYNAWGETRHTTGGSGPTLGYTGEREMADGTVYLRARAYQPRMGKMVQRDGIDPGMWGRGSQGHNRYSYVENNPVNYTDPSGHIVCGGLCIGAAAVGLAALNLAVDAAFNPERVLAPTHPGDVPETRGKEFANEFRATVAGAMIPDGSPGIPDGAVARHVDNMIDDAAEQLAKHGDDALEKVAKQADDAVRRVCSARPKYRTRPLTGASPETDDFFERAEQYSRSNGMRPHIDALRKAAQDPMGSGLMVRVTHGPGRKIAAMGGVTEIAPGVYDLEVLQGTGNGSGRAALNDILDEFVGRRGGSLMITPDQANNVEGFYRHVLGKPSGPLVVTPEDYARMRK